MVARNDSRTPTHWKITARRKARGPQQHRSQWQQQQQHLGRSQMQLSKGDELYPVQRLLWRTIGLSDSTKAAELQAADLESCLAAARTVCLKTVSAALLHILSTTAVGNGRTCMQIGVGFVEAVWRSMGAAAVAASPGTGSILHCLQQRCVVCRHNNPCLLSD